MCLKRLMGWRYFSGDNLERTLDSKIGQSFLYDNPQSIVLPKKSDHKHHENIFYGYYRSDSFLAMRRLPEKMYIHDGYMIQLI